MAKARYKGSGTINNEGDYGVFLTAPDGQPSGGGGVDKFRIKIFHAGDAVYDYVNGGSGDMDIYLKPMRCIWRDHHEYK
jgi:hypothetical protein